jgi:hypothetical protein
MPARWSNRFELKPGRWVYVPTPEARVLGLDIKTQLQKLWSPPDYYFHLQRGGHVAAVRSHLGSRRFMRADIRNFFGSINRTRVTRCLKPLVSYKVAREWAVNSTVRDPRGKVAALPYGFLQSQLLASLCLFESALGRFLHGIQGSNGVIVSVYVDDILISAPHDESLEGVHEGLQLAAERARLTFDPAKGAGPADAVSAFNILLSEASMTIEPGRLQEFAARLAADATPNERQGILSYVHSVCPDQAKAL